MTKEYLVLVKKGCPYCNKIINYMDENTIVYFKRVSGEDFRMSSFKEKFGLNATFPRIYEIVNGKKTFIGGCEESLEYLSKQKK